MIDYHAVPVNGARLRIERKLKNFSQKDLARAACISIRQVQKMERGEKASPRQSIAPVARALGVTWQYLAFPDREGSGPGGEPYFDVDNPPFIVGLHTSKDFDKVCEDEDVKPIFDTLTAFQWSIGHPVKCGLPGPHVLYVGMKPFASALIEISMDACFIWHYLIKCFAERRLEVHNITDLYLPASYIAFWEGPPPLWRQNDPTAGKLFTQLIREQYGKTLSLSTLRDRTVVLTPREVVPNELVPV